MSAAIEMYGSASTGIVGELDPDVPPHNHEAECAVISAVFIDQVWLTHVSDLLRPSHFFSEAHARIYEAILACEANGQPIDIVTVATRLRDTNRLQQVGGVAYLQTVIDASPAPRNIREHGVAIYEAWRTREIIVVAQKVAARGYQGIPDVQAYADAATKAIGLIARAQPGAVIQDNITMLREQVRAMTEASSPKNADAQRPGLRTGIGSIDTLLGGGLQIGKTTVVALPGVGKTVFGLQSCLNVAAHGIGAVLFSTEMPAEEILDRQISSMARVDSHRLARARLEPTLTNDEWSRVYGALKELEAKPIPLHLDATSDLTAEDVCARTRIYVERSVNIDKRPIGLVVLDFLQNLRPSPGLERASAWDQHKHATGLFVRLAKELRICFLELAQRKDAPIDSKTGKRARPKLGDCAEGQWPERWARVVVYLHRDSDNDQRHVEAVVVKARGGRLGTVQLELQGEFSRFVDPRDPLIPASRQFTDDQKHFHEEDDR